MKRNVKAGIAIAIGFLSFLHNNKAMMIAGAIMTIVGFSIHLSKFLTLRNILDA